ncbi:3-hydroxyacyl-CoA dehydrogenase NAD-binding domain-containing protein, partial [Escherichia coli]|nr:3-hydroxyacyl-CoA dehydrogenase NAD-binding domain-containing protein [Escherichia coli]
GLGIAQVFMTSNYHVSLYDMSEEQIKKGIAFIDKQLNRQVEKAAMTKVEKDEVMNRLYPISSLSNAVQVDLVVEAIVEKMEVKQSLFKELD